MFLRKRRPWLVKGPRVYTRFRSLGIRFLRNDLLMVLFLHLSNTFRRSVRTILCIYTGHGFFQFQVLNRDQVDVLRRIMCFLRGFRFFYRTMSPPPGTK